MPEPRKKKPLSVGNSLADLNKHAESVKIDIKTALQCRQKDGALRKLTTHWGILFSKRFTLRFGDKYCASVNDVFKKADARYNDGDEENSYILFMRYFHILESIKKTYEYQKHKSQYNELLVPSNALKAIEKAEILSKSLKERYEQLLADRSSSKIEKVDINKNKKVETGISKQDDVVDGRKSESSSKLNAKPSPSQSNGTSVDKTEGNGMINSLPDVPDSITPIDLKPTPRKVPKVDPWITPEELYGLLIAKDSNSILIFDTRPPSDYETSRIKHKGVVNIPEDLLKPGANVNSIERRLTREVWDVWITRKTKSHVIILDSDSKRSSTRSDLPMRILKDAIFKWDSSGSLEIEPRMLDSGFCGWFLYYPSICTNPFYKKPAVKSTHSIPDAASLLSNLNYPTLPGLATRSVSEGTGLSKSLSPSSKQDLARSQLGNSQPHENTEPRLDRSMSEFAPRSSHNSGITSSDDAIEQLRSQIGHGTSPKNKNPLHNGPGHSQGSRERLPGDTNQKDQSYYKDDVFKTRHGSLERKPTKNQPEASQFYMHHENGITRAGSLGSRQSSLSSNGSQSSLNGDQVNQRKDSLDRTDRLDPNRPVPSLYSNRENGTNYSNTFPRTHGTSSSSLPPRPPPPTDRPATAPITSSVSPNFNRKFGPSGSAETLSSRQNFDGSLSYAPKSTPGSPGMPRASSSSSRNPSGADDIIHAVYPSTGGNQGKGNSLPQSARQSSGPSSLGADRDNADIIKARYPRDMGFHPQGDGQIGPNSKPSGPENRAYGPKSLPGQPGQLNEAYMSPSKAQQYMGESSPTHRNIPADKGAVAGSSHAASKMGGPQGHVPNTAKPGNYGYNATPVGNGMPSNPQPTSLPPQHPGKSMAAANNSMRKAPNSQGPSSPKHNIPPRQQATDPAANMKLPPVPDSNPSMQRPKTSNPNIAKPSQPESPKDPEFVQSAGLPKGWQKNIDSRTGRVYYVDHVTKSTHWELPPDFYATRQRESPQKQKRRAPDTPVEQMPSPTARVPSSSSSSFAGTKDHASDAASNLQPKASMKRSLSTPNLADLVENKENVQPQRPTIDRSSKPMPKTSQLVDRSTKPLSKTRLTSLSPVYGSRGRNLTGLKNLGNTCYMNSVIQSLSNTVPLAKYFYSGSYVKDLNPNSMNRRPEEVAKELAFLINVLWSGQYRSVSPCDFKLAIGRFASQFAGTKQQDAHEFLMFFMDGIHEDTNKIKRKSPMKEQNNDAIPETVAAVNAWKDYTKSNDSVIVDLFQGQFRSTVACKTCSKKSVTFDVFSCLPLELSSRSSCSLTDCIRAFTRPEMIGGNNSWKCSGCKAYREATKTLELWKLPPVIIVQLKRFSSDGIWHNKLQTNVDFPINNFQVSKLLVGPKSDTTYNLFAVINHYGSFESGHYTSYCRNQNKWYCYDDNVVRDIDRNSIKTTAAYLLFYTTMDFTA